MEGGREGGSRGRERGWERGSKRERERVGGTAVEIGRSLGEKIEVYGGRDEEQKRDEVSSPTDHTCRRGTLMQAAV